MGLQTVRSDRDYSNYIDIVIEKSRCLSLLYHLTSEPDTPITGLRLRTNAGNMITSSEAVLNYFPRYLDLGLVSRTRVTGELLQLQTNQLMHLCKRRQTTIQKECAIMMRRRFIMRKALVMSCACDSKPVTRAISSLYHSKMKCLKRQRKGPQIQSKLIAIAQII